MKSWAKTNVFVAVVSRRATVQDSRDGTLCPAAKEIGVPTIACVVALCKDEGVLLDFPVDFRNVERVFHENVRETSGMSTRAVALLDVSSWIHDMSGGVGWVKVLTVPAMWEVNGSIETVI